jgi:hypothetical protein
MKIEFYYDSNDTEPWPENEGLYGQRMEPLLGQVKEAGIDYRVVDPSDLSREELEDAYIRLAVPPSVRKRYGIKRIFGTNKYPGSFFGRQVPALVVLENGRPQDVFPHEEGGKIVTIKDYLERLTKGEEGVRDGRALAKRMDALRAKIGRVGATARELIDEGRRR